MSDLDVEVPRVVLVMGDVDPGVVGDHPLVEGQDRLIARLDPAHLSARRQSPRSFMRTVSQDYCEGHS